VAPAGESFWTLKQSRFAPSTLMQAQLACENEINVYSSVKENLGDRILARDDGLHTLRLRPGRRYLQSLGGIRVET
jgi:hypothetical protein